MSFQQITIIGVGLIGGSIGLAARKRQVARHIIGVGRNAGTLARAVEIGAIDAGTSNLAEGVREADLVVVCSPVDTIARIVIEAADHCRPGTLFTDGGSTKGKIVAAVRNALPRGVDFVPAHPLAGSEKTGAENGHADLFVNRTTIVTPYPENRPEAVARVEAFWRQLGSRTVAMDPIEHDRVLAMTSHLPHIVSSAAAAVTPREFLPFTAGGFRDVTRIAAGDPHLWEAIFQANREAVLAALAAFSDRIVEFRKMLEAGDGAGLVRWLTEAKQVRDALGCGDSSARA
jgi:prephenate dehydrogenase